MRFKTILGTLAVVLSGVASTAGHAQTSADALEFGGPADIAYATRLWETLRQARLVGADAIHARPYEGIEPHGSILITLDTTVGLDGREAPVLVKKNYGGPGVSIQSVSDNPRLNLGAITVMARREPGYDPGARDWFWVKYRPNGTVDRNPRGVALAGRVAKNPEDGCIACHRLAPGDDFVFLHDRFVTPAVAGIRQDELRTASAALPVPLAPQPSPGSLEPGLGVTYYFNIFNFVDEIRQFAQLEDGVPGRPLPALAYLVGSGEVLTSGHRDGVGAVIEGLINFPDAGTYTLAMQSNDGVELTIGGQVVIRDPNVHADRYSELTLVEIDEPGWYPLELLYFEKRNTSTLELYWLPPGAAAGGLTFVPADSFAHIPG